jgi:Papain-like cysteine protease AvrRpt2
MYRDLPPYVRQNAAWTCWAAGLQSWLAITPNRRKASQEELVAEYATHENGGLDPISDGATANRDFETLAEDFSIEYAVMAGSDLTAEFIDQKLQRGHVLLIFNSVPGVAHTNVVYGVGFPTGREKLISVMDPSETGLEPQTGLYRNRPITFYNSRSFVIVAWPIKIA